MSIDTILTFIVVISFGTNHLVHGEVLRGQDIPRPNVTGLVGRWYRAASTRAGDEVLCAGNFVKEQSTDKFTMYVTLGYKPHLQDKNPIPPKVVYEADVEATMKNDTNIISIKNNNPYDGSRIHMVIFDVVYDSYMVMYLAVSTEEIASGHNGNIYIFSRNKAMSAEIIENVKKSVFYREGVNPKNELRSTDQTVCE